METLIIQPQWQPLLLTDLAQITRISHEIHPQLFEDESVFKQKIQYCPKACLKWCLNQQIYGYGLAHPWKLAVIPKLNHLLNPLYSTADCIYLHDVAILPVARGFNATEQYVNYLIQLARSLDIYYLALVSVYTTETFWQKLGFYRYETNELTAGLIDYGDHACYMIYQL